MSEAAEVSGESETAPPLQVVQVTEQHTHKVKDHDDQELAFDCSSQPAEA